MWEGALFDKMYLENNDYDTTVMERRSQAAAKRFA
jgi:hypothetical protein